VSLRGWRRSGERAPVAGSSHLCQTGPEKAAGKLGGVEAVNDLELMGRFEGDLQVGVPRCRRSRAGTLPWRRSGGSRGRGGVGSGCRGELWCGGGGGWVGGGEEGGGGVDLVGGWG
jgi:hypothetical protein